MPTIRESIEVPYSNAEMYALINQIDAYAEFLPWCSESRILSQEQHMIQAKLTLRGGGFSKSFTTANYLQPNQRVVISLVDGPFRHLKGCWTFEPTRIGCKICLNLQFEFSSHLLAMAFSPIFEKVVRTLTQAFSDRAKQIYGERQLPP